MIAAFSVSSLLIVLLWLTVLTRKFREQKRRIKQHQKNDIRHLNEIKALKTEIVELKSAIHGKEESQKTV